MGRSEDFNFVISDSGHADVNHKVWVSKPDQEASGTPARVIYVTDGNWLFPIVAGYVKTLRLFEPGFHNTVVVGIGYDCNDDSVINQLRLSDLAPLQSHPDSVVRFRELLSNRVREEISQRYGVSRGRDILVGHSWGGAFTLFTLLTTPDAFEGYISCSPPVYNSVLPDLEESFFGTGQDLQARLRLYVGGNEDDLLPQVLKFSRQLEGRAYKGFDLASHVFQEESHTTVIMPAIARALSTIF